METITLELLFYCHWHIYLIGTYSELLGTNYAQLFSW